MVQSACLSVCLSVTPFWLCSHHRIIMKFSGVKGQGQRSKFKITEVNTQLNGFRTVTPVWIHIWWWNDAYSLMKLRRGALLFFKVICRISRSHRSKKRRIWPRLGCSVITSHMKHSVITYACPNQWDHVNKRVPDILIATNVGRFTICVMTRMNDGSLKRSLLLQISRNLFIFTQLIFMSWRFLHYRW